MQIMKLIVNAIDSGVLNFLVFCPNILFAILFSHTPKVRNEVLRTYENDCPSGSVALYCRRIRSFWVWVLPHPEMEAAGFSETLLCYQTTPLNILEEYSSMRNLCIILLFEMLPERYTSTACLAYSVLCSVSEVGNFVWNLGTFQPDYTASHSRRQ
jgi:hypothetical protein